jgi:beta-lactamase class A
MQTQMSRRAYGQLVLGGLMLAGCRAAPTQVKVDLSQINTAPVQDLTALALGELESRVGGRLGVAFLDPATGRRTSHRGDERFAMASTFKLALAAVILRQADQGNLDLNLMLPISEADLAGHSPVVRENLAKRRMSLEELARATQTTSDNAAANLLLRHIGGPAIFTAQLRALGDNTTRLDRYEPDMMKVNKTEVRDTTTPEAMAKTLAKMLTRDWLSPAAQTKLINWMVETQTGLKRLRAGLPPNWRAGDKTGTGLGEASDVPDRYNDIAIIWPPGSTPIFVAAYYESPVRSQTMREEDMAVLAQVGTIAAQWAIAT